jgi:hypothetical protein
MIIKKAVKAATLILSFSLLSVLYACGELSTSLLSSNGTYQVKALVNGSSLEACSIIRKDDKIIPYFAVSVANDQDLTGLLVYLQNSTGEIVGERVLYTIEHMDETAQAEARREETADEASIEEASSGEDAFSVEGAEGETAGYTDTKLPEIESKPSTKKYDTVIQVKSFNHEMPRFPLPKNLGIGQYSLVFETVGRHSTLSITESYIFYLGSAEFRLNDISMYLPWLSDTGLIPPGAMVMLEAGLDFDSRFNPYVIWYNGRNIISEGNLNEGAGNILWKAPEQPSFYSLRLEVLPYRLKRNFTGISREITLPVSAKASQTGYFFKGPPAAGTAYTELVQPAATQTAATTFAENIDKTAAAPIMSEHPELLRWYRFEGILDDTSLIHERAFVASSNRTPRWAAVGQSYGLSVGPDDDYSLRSIRLIRQGEDQGGGIFLSHIKPAAEGTVFSAFFPSLASASDGVWMEMTALGNTVTLCLKKKNSSVKIPINTGNSAERGFIPIVVEFYIRPNRLEAKISLGEKLSAQNTSAQGAAGYIRLPGALTGEVRIKLGMDKTAPAETKSGLVSPNETAQTEGADNENKTSPVTVVSAGSTIWDEFAVLYSTIPFLHEGIFAEESLETEDAPLKNEAPLVDIQAKNILIEQESAEAKTEYEETPLLISIQ